jgi:hypothetical protein
MRNILPLASQCETLVLNRVTPTPVTKEKQSMKTLLAGLAIAGGFYFILDVLFKAVGL